MSWTQRTVESKLISNPEFQSFISRKKGYLLLTIGRTRVVILREEVGVSYFFLYPINYQNIADAIRVNEFMHFAIPFLNKELEKSEGDYLYNPHPRVEL